MSDIELKEVKSVEEKDRLWLDTVYRGDKERDLTPRAIMAGMVFGGLMSLSNLYVGLKSGWGLGVDIAAVIVIFAVFKALHGIGLVKREFGLMESTIMMTVAVAASWISSAGLVSAVPALTMLTGYEFVWWQLALFIAVILYLGLFMAIPLKRQMIQIDSLRFPANIPTGETLKAMYSHGGEAMKKAKALGIAGGLGMLVAGLRDGLSWIPGQFNFGWQIQRIGMGKLTLSLEPSLIFIGIGALFGMKVGLSMLLGLILNYAVLAPNLINAKIIHHPPPQVTATSLAKWPLAVSAGQSLTVSLEQASVGPELSSGAITNTFSYAWTRAVTYTNLAEVERDLEFARNWRTVRRILSTGLSACAPLLAKPSVATWSPSRPRQRRIGRPGFLFPRTKPAPWRPRWVLNPARPRCSEWADSGTSVPGLCGRGRPCWWSAAFWRWLFNGARWRAPSAGCSRASAVGTTRRKACWITLRFPCAGSSSVSCSPAWLPPFC